MSSLCSIGVFFGCRFFYFEWIIQLLLVLRSEFDDQGFEEVLGGGVRGGDLRFQLVHHGRQLIHFGHDTAFGEG